LNFIFRQRAIALSIFHLMGITGILYGKQATSKIASGS